MEGDPIKSEKQVRATGSSGISIMSKHVETKTLAETAENWAGRVEILLENGLLQDERNACKRLAQSFLHFVEASLTEDWLQRTQHRKAAAKIWKEIFPRDKVLCTICGSKYATIMNCPWNGTVCIECCDDCEKGKWTCDYL